MVTVLNQQPCGLEGSSVVVGCHIWERRIAGLAFVVTVYQHHRNLLGHLTDACRIVGTRRHNDAVDIARHERVERAILVKGVFTGIDHHHRIGVFVRFLYYNTGNICKKRVLYARNQQTYGMGGRTAQTLRSMVRTIIKLPNRLIYYILRGFADAALFGFAVEHTRYGGDRQPCETGHIG